MRRWKKKKKLQKRLYLNKKKEGITHVKYNKRKNVNYTLISNNNKVLESRYVDASKKWYLYGLKNETAIVTCKVINENETELTDDYVLTFERESEPYTYEPNVKHVLMKTAETFDILSANTKYLLLNEFVWCKGNNSLYFKAEDSTGAINLFKINGGGGTPDPDVPVEPDIPVEPDEPETGTTTDINVNIDYDGILNLTDNNEEKTLYVDENDVLTIPDNVAYINDEDQLVFKTTQTGTTVDINVKVDTNDVLDLYDKKQKKTLYVDENDVLTIPNNVGYVDEDGLLVLKQQETGITTDLNINIDNDNILNLKDNKINKTLKVDENDILTIPNEAAYIDDDGLLVFKKQVSGETNFTINEEDELIIKHGATIEEDGSLKLSKDLAEIDENGILIFKQKTVNPNINIDFNEDTNELNINGPISLDNGILTIVGSIDKNGILTLNETQQSININGETLEINSEIDNEGYLTLTNVEVDEEGYIIIK